MSIQLTEFFPHLGAVKIFHSDRYPGTLLFVSFSQTEAEEAMEESDLVDMFMTGMSSNQKQPDFTPDRIIFLAYLCTALHFLSNSRRVFIF